jgi:Flp pilus assembly protein TadD
VKKSHGGKTPFASVNYYTFNGQKYERDVAKSAELSRQLTTQPEAKAAEVADTSQTAKSSALISNNSNVVPAIDKADAVAGVFAKNGLTPKLQYIENMLMGSSTDDERMIMDNKALLENLPKTAKGEKKAARAINEQALSHFNNGELEEAVKLFKDASQLDKSDPEILNNLGYALLKQGNIESSEDAILETLAIAPGRSTAWQNLGDILAIKNDTPKGIAAYENVYRFSKNRVKTHQFMQKLNANEDVSSLKQARQMAMNWAEKSYPEINE